MKAINCPATSKSWPREAVTYGVTFVLALVLTIVILRLWHAEPRVPFAYEHDSKPVLTWVKGMVDNGWWTTNEFLGAPSRMEMYDYPLGSNLHFAILKALSLFTSDPALIVNVYFLLSFPLIAVASLMPLRSMSVSRMPSMAASLLYTFLPYHFWRGEAHLFLSAYFMIPLLFLVIIWIAKGEVFLIVRTNDARSWRLELKSQRAIFSLLICMALGSDSPYYPVFACVLLAVAGLCLFARTLDLGSLLRPWLLGAVVAASFLANLSPSLVYWWQHGPNLSPEHTSKRPWSDATTLGLTITQMVLPTAGHRIESLSKLHDKFYAGTPLPSENDSMTLGLIGSAGLVLLLGSLIWCQRSQSQLERLHYLFGVLTVCAILIGTMGGFGTLFNLLGVSIMRCYNRLSIFIGFLALAAVFSLLDNLFRRIANRRLGWVLAQGGTFGMLILGLWDQTSMTRLHGYRPDYRALQKSYQNDAEFVAAIEAAVPENTMVFQFPYLSWLSYINAYHQMTPYSHLRGYLHSHSLRWSFGAMHGRAGDALHAEVASLPVGECVEGLGLLGFGGIYVDRYGYADGGKNFENQLRELLQVEPVVSNNGRFTFFAMAGYEERLRRKYPEETWQKQYETLVRASEVKVKWGEGFFPEEVLDSDRWHWCGAKGVLEITNPSSGPRVVSLKFRAHTCLPGAAALTIRCPFFEETIPISENRTTYDNVFRVPPGTHGIQFECAAAPYVHPMRTVVFAVHDLRIVQVDSDSLRLARSPGPHGGKP